MEIEDQSLSVGELIKELQQYNPNAHVILKINGFMSLNSIDTFVETLDDRTQQVTIEGYV